MVYASSIAVYGVQETFGERPVDEEDLSSPINVYGMTKAANDFAAGRYRDRYGMDVRGVRICTVFGHGRVTGMTGMIGGLMMSLPAIGQPVAMEFDPSEASPMIHAEDAAEMFVQVALSTSLNHSIYISGGHLATIQDMATLVREFVPDAQITTGDRPVPHVYLVDNSRMLAGYRLRNGSPEGPGVGAHERRPPGSRPAAHLRLTKTSRVREAKIREIAGN